MTFVLIETKQEETVTIITTKNVYAPNMDPKKVLIK